MRSRTSFTLAALLLAGCGVAPGTTSGGSTERVQAKADSVPYVRVFQGVRRLDMSVPNFLDNVSHRLLPAAPASQANNGLTAYLAALSPKVPVGGVPDAISLETFKSQASYEQATGTHEGQQFMGLQWQIFDRDRSSSLQAVSLDSTGGKLLGGTAYDLVHGPTQWQGGFTTFLIGLRPEGCDAATFLTNVTQHVKKAVPAFSSRGMDGYVVVAEPGYVVSYMHWHDVLRYTAAMATGAGRDFMSEGDRVMDRHMYVNAVDFDGQIKQGDLVNVRFQPR